MNFSFHLHINTSRIICCRAVAHLKLLLPGSYPKFVCPFRPNINKNVILQKKPKKCCPPQKKKKKELSAADRHILTSSILLHHFFSGQAAIYIDEKRYLLYLIVVWYLIHPSKLHCVLFIVLILPGFH